MFIEIVSPEKTIFTGNITSAYLPGSEGFFQILDNHAPIVSTLISGTVKISGEIEDSNSLPDSFSVISPKEIHLSVSSGVVEMKENKVIILTD